MNQFNIVITFIGNGQMKMDRLYIHQSVIQMMVMVKLPLQDMKLSIKDSMLQMLMPENQIMDLKMDSMRRDKNDHLNENNQSDNRSKG